MCPPQSMTKNTEHRAGGTYKSRGPSCIIAKSSRKNLVQTLSPQCCQKQACGSEDQRMLAPCAMKYTYLRVHNSHAKASSGQSYHQPSEHSQHFSFTEATCAHAGATLSSLLALSVWLYEPHVAASSTHGTLSAPVSLPSIMASR